MALQTILANDTGQVAAGKILANDTENQTNILANTSAVNDVKNVLGYGTAIVAYPINFSPLTIGPNGINNIYINETAKVSGACVLNTWRIHAAVAAVCTVYVYNITFNSTGGAIYELLHTYAPFTLTTETQSVTVTDGFVIPDGAYIGVKSDKGIFYMVAQYQGFTPPLTGRVGNITAFDFTVRPFLATGLVDRVADLEDIVDPLSGAAETIDDLVTQADANSLGIALNTGGVQTATIDVSVLQRQMAALLLKNPTALQLHTQIVFDGDSLDAGVGATDPATTSWPAVLKSHLGTVDYGGYFNIAVSGQLVSSMLTRQPTQLIPKYDGVNYQKNLVVVGGGINDLFGGISPVDVYNNLKTYHNNAQAAGFETIALTHTVTKKEYGVGVAIGEAGRQALDAMIRKGWAKDFKASAFVDLGSDPRIGDFANQDTSLFISDLQHFNDVGYAYKESLIRPAVIAVCAQSRRYGLVKLDNTSVITFSDKQSTSARMTWTPSADASGYVVLRNTTNTLTGATEVYRGAGPFFITTGNFDLTEYFYFLKPTGDPDYFTDGDYTSKRHSNLAPTVAGGNLRRFAADSGFNGTTGVWTDAAGSGDTAQPETATLPILVPGFINGKAAIKFNASNLSTTNMLGMTGSNPRSFAAVIYLTTAANQSLFGLGDQIYSAASGNVGKIYDLIVYTNHLTGHAVGNLAVAAPTVEINKAVFVGIRTTASEATVYYGDTETVLTAGLPSPALLNSVLKIGGGHYSTIPGMTDAYIAELIIRNDGDQNSFDQNKDYLIAKYGL